MTASPELALELADLVMHFGPVRAVDGISLRVRAGGVTALVGESGSGKSTVGRCIVRLLEPTAGVVRIGGTDVTHLSRRQMRPHRRSVSIVFQDPAGSLDPRMLVGDVVGEPLRLLAGRLSRRDRDSRVATELGRVGLRTEVAKRYPHELSGGQRQRVSIARALVSSPSLLIADEPTSALDATVQAEILRLMEDLVSRRGMGLLLISHDLPLVGHFCDRVAVMYAGRVVETLQAGELARAQHPYTRGLLECMPSLSHPRLRLPVMRRDPAWLGA